MADLKIVPFKFKNLSDLHRLLNSQSYEGVATIQMPTLPKVGYIVYMGKEPIAAGFLRRLEPCFCQLDTLATNANFGSILRHQALNTLVDTLLADAKRLKLKGVICHTADTGILKRAESLGFHIVPQTIIGLPL